MEQFTVKINMPRHGEVPLVKSVAAGGGIVLSKMGEREGKVNTHRLLAVDKHKVVLPNPIEFKVGNAQEKHLIF